MISSASRDPSSGCSGVALTRTTTSSPSTSSSSTDFALGMATSWSRIACTWLGRIPWLSRTRTSIASGSLSGTMTAASTPLLGIITRSLPWLSTV